MAFGYLYRVHRVAGSGRPAGFHAFTFQSAPCHARYFAMETDSATSRPSSRSVIPEKIDFVILT